MARAARHHERRLRPPHAKWPEKPPVLYASPLALGNKSDKAVADFAFDPARLLPKKSSALYAPGQRRQALVDILALRNTY